MLPRYPRIAQSADYGCAKPICRVLATIWLLAMTWSPGALAGHGSYSAEVSEIQSLIVHIADRVNVTGTLQLASPQTIGIDRVRLLQPLTSYYYTADTRIVSVRRYGDHFAFELSAPGRIALPISLHLLLENRDELEEVISTRGADMPVPRSRNSFRIDVLVDPAPFVRLDPATATPQLILLIAPM